MLQFCIYQNIYKYFQYYFEYFYNFCIFINQLSIKYYCKFKKCDENELRYREQTFQSNVGSSRFFPRHIPDLLYLCIKETKLQMI